MDLCLSHPEHGYYNKGKIFGKEGDFITSPELSQLFGESLAVFISTLYTQLNHPAKWHIVELGPGKGSLAVDILRVLKKLGFAQGLSVHFVDLSNHLKTLQQKAILSFCGQLQYEKYKNIDRYFDRDLSFYWYTSLSEVNRIYAEDYSPQPVVIIAHEVFDALPVHIFEFSSELGWCECLVGLSNLDQFELTLSKGPNKNVQSILKPEKFTSKRILQDLKPGDRIEQSPASLKLCSEMCEILKQSEHSSGIIIDYGDSRAFGSSIRVIDKQGIKNHEKIAVEEWLQMPGEVDLSAYVDFAALEAVVARVKELRTGQLVPQGFFLEAMGISARVEMLSRKHPKSKERLMKDYERLASPEMMGEIYKCMFVGHKHMKVYPFTDTDIEFHKNN
jgi:NADH dehydrogenase [ubiquinone] 1 alpha subcomplex assembly factor 7